jgi:hypothetical protein
VCPPRSFSTCGASALPADRSSHPPFPLPRVVVLDHVPCGHLSTCLHRGHRECALSHPCARLNSNPPARDSTSVHRTHARTHTRSRVHVHADPMCTRVLMRLHNSTADSFTLVVQHLRGTAGARLMRTMHNCHAMHSSELWQTHDVCTLSLSSYDAISHHSCAWGTARAHINTRLSSNTLTTLAGTMLVV